MIIHEIEQRSDKWQSLRAGRITASCFDKVLSSGTTRNTYMLQILAERLTGLPEDSYSNSYMEWGIENEPFAREYYELLNDVQVQEVGFVELDEWVGVSPDGLIVEDGTLEIKCPKTTTHLDYILKNKLPSKYKPQVQGQLWVTDRKWCDFISFDPRVKDRPYFCIRVERDQKYISELEQACNKFVEELKEKLQTITEPF